MYCYIASKHRSALKKKSGRAPSAKLVHSRETGPCLRLLISTAVCVLRGGPCVCVSPGVGTNRPTHRDRRFSSSTSTSVVHVADFVYCRRRRVLPVYHLASVFSQSGRRESDISMCHDHRALRVTIVGVSAELHLFSWPHRVPLESSSVIA